MEFNVGDLLIEEPMAPMPPNWKPRIGICMEWIPSRTQCFLVSILIGGQVVLSRPSFWRVACQEE